MTEEKKCILFLVILLHFSRGISGLQPSRDNRGPYETAWKHIDDCGKEDAFLRFHVRTRKMSRTLIQVEGDFTVRNRTLNDDIKVKSSLHKFTPSGWKDNFLVFDFGDKGFCTAMKDYLNPRDYHNIVSKIYSATLGENDGNQTCPMEPDEYIVGGVRYDLTDVRGITGFPQNFFYGTYRLMVYLYNEDFSHEVGCIAIYFDLVPKKKKNG